MSRIIQNNNKQNNKINTISIQTVKKNEKKTSSTGIYIYIIMVIIYCLKIENHKVLKCKDGLSPFKEICLNESPLKM